MNIRTIPHNPRRTAAVIAVAGLLPPRPNRRTDAFVDRRRTTPGKGAMMQKLRVALVPLVVPLVLLAAAAVFVASPAGAASAVTVVATVNGGGTAVMTDGKGVSTFGFEATLYSDHTARGHFDCVDHMGDAPGYPGNIFGEITGWSQNGDGTINLLVANGKALGFPHTFFVPGGLPFTVTIQRTGGAGVGHWTLTVDGAPNPICIELLLSGQVIVRGSLV